VIHGSDGELSLLIGATGPRRTLVQRYYRLTGTVEGNRINWEQPQLLDDANARADAFSRVGQPAMLSGRAWLVRLGSVSVQGAPTGLVGRGASVTFATRQGEMIASTAIPSDNAGERHVFGPKLLLLPKRADPADHDVWVSWGSGLWRPLLVAPGE
jgi:hypothetical protein